MLSTSIMLVRKRVFTWIFLAVVSVHCPVFAQEKREPPIPFETFFGNERVALSLSANKSIGGKFRYNNVTSASAFYDREKGVTEIVSVNSIVYQLHKNIGISTGMQYHFMKGLVPSLALHLSYSNPTWLLALTPYYNFMPWSNLETVGIVEFKPALNESWRLFTRVMGFYSQDFEKNERERAMFYFRLGATYKKYTFGVGGNIDGYRPGRPTIRNYGGFVRIDI